MPRFTGQSIERVEDPRFLTGADRFVSAIDRPGMRHVAFVRSPHAHARIVGVDTAAARALPGVVAVLTASDLVPCVQAQTVHRAARAQDPVGHAAGERQGPLRRRPGRARRRRHAGDRGRRARSRHRRLRAAAGGRPDRPRPGPRAPATVRRARRQPRVPRHLGLGRRRRRVRPGRPGGDEELLAAPDQPRPARGARRRGRLRAGHRVPDVRGRAQATALDAARDVDAARDPVRRHPRRRARHRRRVRLEGPGHPRGRRAVRGGEARRGDAEVDRGAQREPPGRRTRARGDDGRRRRRHRRRAPARTARADGPRPGRVPDAPVPELAVPVAGAHTPARCLQARRVLVRDDDRRDQQGELHLVPRTLGGRDVGPRPDAGRDRP